MLWRGVVLVLIQNALNVGADAEEEIAVLLGGSLREML